MPSAESKAVAKKEKKPESLTTREKLLYCRLVLRICVILLTIMASLWMITTRVFIFIFGIPPRSDIIGKVAMYMDAASICLLCLLIIFLEFDWLRVMQYFGFASFYVGKAIIQVMCGVFAFGAALEGIYQTLAETASYFMFGVGVLHFALGIFCLEKYCLGVRSSYQQLNK